MHDLEQKCLLCLKLYDDFIEIFGRRGRLKKISEILSKHFWFEIKENSIHSKLICSNCWQKTREFHDFYCSVEKLFQKYLIKYESDNDIDKFMDIDFKDDYSDIELDKLKAELDFSDDVASQTFNNENDGSAGHMDNSSTAFENDHQENVENIDTVNEKSIVNDDTKTIKKVSKKSEPVANEQKLANRKKIQDENNKIREFFNLKCEICLRMFDSFAKLRAHYRIEHDVYGYVICCKKKIYRRCFLLEHIDWHTNPAAFTCGTCHRTYSDKAGLKEHQLRHNPDSRRDYTCDQCGKEFILKREFEKHTLLVHSKPEDKKFICDDCDKRFILKSMLFSHIRNMHQTVCAQVCDVCAKTFKNKYILKKHRETHDVTSSKPRLECNQCGALLKTEISLRSHILRHSDTVHTCNLCGKTCPNRFALSGHIRYVHSKRTHKCTICDKAFPTSIALKEHMAAHTGQSLYSCPYCTRTFVSGGNMHKHKKRVHSEQWHLDRQKRLSGSIS